MRSIDHVVETDLISTPRVKQLSGMFDVPAREKLRHEWHGAIPIDERAWQIGLLIGPSGMGKSTLLRELFGEPVRMQWGAGFQGMGLAFVLLEALGAAHKRLGNRFHNYPAHPAFVRASDRSPHWALRKRPGTYSPRVGSRSSIGNLTSGMSKMGSRPCAVFEYVGPAAQSRDEARALIEGSASTSNSRERPSIGIGSSICGLASTNP